MIRGSPSDYRERMLACHGILRSRPLVMLAVFGLTGSLHAQARPGRLPEAGRQIRQQEIVPGILNRAGNTDDRLDVKRIRGMAVPKQVKGLVVRLGADRFEDRMEATTALREHPAPDEALMAALAAGGLSEEQRLRLVGILEWRIMNRPRGAVGIRMQRRPLGSQPAGIEIQQVIPGLPAERVLRVGDVLQKLDDVAVSENEDLILHVQRMKPGDALSVELLRPVPAPGEGEVAAPRLVEGDRGRWFEPVQVELRLGSFEQLGDDGGITNAETMRRRMVVDQVRGLWGDPPSRKRLRPPPADTVPSRP